MFFIYCSTDIFCGWCTTIPDRRCSGHFGLKMTNFATFEKFCLHMLEAPLIVHHIVLLFQYALVPTLNGNTDNVAKLSVGA
jgi:hypothetical protein